MDSLKVIAWPFILGAVVGAALLTFGAGFMSPSTASKLAEEARVSGIVAVLTPSCVVAAQADPDGLAAVMSKSAFQQRAEVGKTNWPVYPDGASAALKRAIDEGCLEALKNIA
jgi:hypothetical protein